MTEPRLTNPYVGPRPFQRSDAHLFVGRETEAQELVALITAFQSVLVYASSGAGKTSLLNAAVIPLLDEQEFEILPVARVQDRYVTNTTPPGANVYVHGLLSNWEDYLHNDQPGGHPLTLADYLRRREYAVTRDGLPAPRVVIIDQIEEVFSLYPERWEDQQGFFLQLAEALDLDPLLRIVLSLREDRLAELEDYASLFPDSLRARLRVQPLLPDAALRAIQAPSALAGRTFAPGVAERLVEELLTVRVDRGPAGLIQVRGKFVEPLLLQAVCIELWSNLPTGSSEIVNADLRRFESVDEALVKLCDATLTQAARRSGTNEKRLRMSVEAAFITPAGTRGLVYRGAKSTGGIPDEAVAVLEANHLIRGEFRAGARWYELIHDRLIEPIRVSNQTYLRSRRRFGFGRLSTDKS